jgi:hypothetical protein
VGVAVDDHGGRCYRTDWLAPRSCHAECHLSTMAPYWMPNP